jgi:hypothetical protein
MNAAALRISRKPGSHDEGSSSGLTGLVHLTNCACIIIALKLGQNGIWQSKPKRLR